MAFHHGCRRRAGAAKYLAPTILLALALLISFNVDDGEGVIQRDGKMLILTEKDYDMATRYYPHVLVAFHTNWCGICDKFKKDMRTAAEILHDDPSKKIRKVKLALVDCEKEKGLARKFGIFGYPTVKFYIYGTPIEYKGGMGAKRIARWIKRKIKKGRAALKP